MVLRPKFKYFKSNTLIEMTIKIQNILMSVLFTTAVASQPCFGQSPDRANAPAEMKWNLADIYPSWDAWKADLQKVTALADELQALKGKLGESSDNYLRSLQINEEINKISFKLYCFPYLSRSVDSRNQETNSYFMQVLGFFQQLGTATSWVTPEMVTIPETTVMNWIEGNMAYAPYRFGITELYRTQKHVLSGEQEKLLSYFGLATGAPSNIYTELATSDIRFPDITLSDGSTVKLTPGTFQQIIQFNKNRDDRKKAYELYNEVYNANLNTFAAILNGVFQGDWAGAQARNYDSFLQACLDSDNIPTDVYLNLINTARDNTAPLLRYFELRKKVLKVDTLQSWDNSLNLSSFEKKYSYEEARGIIREALKPLGKEYGQRLEKAMANGWIDVYEGEGKEQGAYSMGVYGVHPFILMNYNETLDHVSTLAHELGHSMHTTLSHENQPFSTASYSSFVAEVASNFNEDLLADYLMKNTTNREERINLLEQSIVQLIGSFYRQSQFADFEYQARTLVEKGEGLNAGTLKAISSGISKSYYGSIVADNPYRDLVWAQVMHFYQMKYYVYQYATSYAAAAHLEQKITSGTAKEKEDALQKYLTLLKSGGNDHPIEQLKKAGVDMTNPEVIKSVVTRLNNLLDQLEAELKAAGKI